MDSRARTANWGVSALQGIESIVQLQQHGASRCGLTGQFVVGLEIEGLLGCFPVISENQLHHAHDGSVQIGFVQKTCPDGLGDELVVPVVDRPPSRSSPGRRSPIPRPGSLDYSFEYTEVHFPQCSVIDSPVYSHSIQV